MLLISSQFIHRLKSNKFMLQRAKWLTVKINPQRKQILLFHINLLIHFTQSLNKRWVHHRRLSHKFTYLLIKSSTKRRYYVRDISVVWCESQPNFHIVWCDCALGGGALLTPVALRDGFYIRSEGIIWVSGGGGGALGSACDIRTPSVIGEGVLTLTADSMLRWSWANFYIVVQE